MAGLPVDRNSVRKLDLRIGVKPIISVIGETLTIYEEVRLPNYAAAFNQFLLKAFSECARELAALATRRERTKN